MPLFEFRCKKCHAVTEVLCRWAEAESRAVCCGQCGGPAAKVISRVSFMVAKPAKYSDAFLHKARPFLRSRKETAQYFAEGEGSEDAKTFHLAERIGARIDRTLAARLPLRRR